MKKNLNYIPILENINEFTIAKSKHLVEFQNNEFDLDLYDSKIDIINSRLKTYQDLLVYTFIIQYIEPGSKILEIGGGASRILPKFAKRYECWNIDKFDGLGNGPCQIPDSHKNIHVIEDYIGNFNNKLPKNYFDFVFSISVLEHVPDNDQNFQTNIINEIQIVLKKGGYSLHCFDILKKNSYFWIHNLILSFFENDCVMNRQIPAKDILKLKDVFFMSEKAYNKYWRDITKRDYKLFGIPTSYNIFIKK